MSTPDADPPKFPLARVAFGVAFAALCVLGLWFAFVGAFEQASTDTGRIINAMMVGFGFLTSAVAAVGVAVVARR